MTDEEKKKQEDEGFAKEIHDIRSIVETINKDGKKHESEIKRVEEKVFARVDEKQAEYDKAIADMKAEKEKQDQEIKDKLDEIHTNVERMKLFGDQKTGGERSIEQKAQMDTFMDYTRTGPGALANHEKKTYVVGTDAAAGYLVAPPYYATELLDQALLEITPALALATQERVPSGQYEVPAITAHAVAGRVGETGPTTEDDTFAVGQEIIRSDYMTVKLKMSRALVADSRYNLEGIMSKEVSQAMSKKLGTEFCTGNSNVQMEGIAINASIVANNVINSGSATTVAAGTEASSKGLNGLYFNIKTAYASNANFLLRRATMGRCYGLVDANGQYLLRWGLNQLEGKPVWSMIGSSCIECADMPAIAGDAYPIAYGDFKAGYKIIVTEGMSMLNDPYSSKETNIVEYMWWQRIGGKVVIPEAIHLQKIAV